MHCGFKMACFRTDEWKDDVNLKEELQRYVNQMYKRREILNFVEKDFPQYTWSVRTLDRCLRYFEIYYSDKDVDLTGNFVMRTEDLSCALQILGAQMKI